MCLYVRSVKYLTVVIAGNKRNKTFLYGFGAPDADCEYISNSNNAYSYNYHRKYKFGMFYYTYISSSIEITH